MILKPEQRKGFEEVVEPAIKWLNENCHPMVILIITPNSAEITEGICSHRTDKFIKD